MSSAHKSRFRSATGKKIEKEVRRDATRFRTFRGVASGTNHCSKPIMDSNTGQKRNILLNEKLASSAMKPSKTNKRDNVANDTNRRDNVSSSTMNTRKSNRIDDGTLASVSRTDNKNTVAVEPNGQVNHSLRPMKNDPPRKNIDTKRVETIMPNGDLTHLERSSKSCQLITPLSNEMRQPTTSCLITRRDDSIVALRSSEDHDPLKAKTTMNISNHINNSQSPSFKAMEGLVHRTKKVDGCHDDLPFDGLDGYNDALPSRLKRQISLDNEGGFVVDNHSAIELTTKESGEASPKRMKKQTNKEAKGDDTSDRNPMGEINGDAYPFGVKDYSEKNITFGPMKRQRGNTKTDEDDAIGNGDMKLMVVEDGGTQLETYDHRPKNNKKKRGIESIEAGDGKDDDSFAKTNLESLRKDHVSLGCGNEPIKAEKLTRRKLKKWKQDIMRNEDEELHVDGGDHILLDVHNGSLRLTSQDPISKDYLAEVAGPFVLEHVKQQCNYCSKPIDKPIWSGTFKIDGEEYISLAGHLSTKSCDKVWELSRSLVPVLDVTKISRPKFRVWETSKPSCDSIGLYFFPNEMRHDEHLDKLVKEVIEDDLVLQTIIDEAEMLIFPSTLLPERYKTFQRKHYLWGVFRPRQDQCATVAEPMHDTACRAQENEKEEQHVSNQQDEVQEVQWKAPAETMQQAAATRGVSWSPNMDLAPDERELGDALRHTLHSAEANAVATNPASVTTEAAANPAAETTEAAALATNAATGPAEATENGTNVATIPRNHGRGDSIAGVPPGSYFCFVAEPSPKLQQLIQEMQREGSLVLAIRGKSIGGGIWPGNIAPTNISRA